MNNKTIVNHIIGIVAFTVLLTTNLPSVADEPTSTITPSSNQYALCNDSAENVTLTTSQVPTPICPGDPTEGLIIYYWDFDSLDGTNNGDGTATVKTDTAGTGEVGVYSEQLFMSLRNASIYVADTQTTTSPTIVHIQKPTSLSYLNVQLGGEGAGFPGAFYQLEIDDADDNAILSQPSIIGYEWITGWQDIWYLSNGTVTYHHDFADTGGQYNAPDPGTDSAGCIWDYPVGAGYTVQVKTDAQTFASMNSGAQEAKVVMVRNENYYYYDPYNGYTGYLYSPYQTVTDSITWSNATTVGSVSATAATPAP